MAKRITKRQLLGLKLASLDDAEVQEVLDYLAVIETLRRPTDCILRPTGRHRRVARRGPGKQASSSGLRMGSNAAARRASRVGHSGASNMKTASQVRYSVFILILIIGLFWLSAHFCFVFQFRRLPGR